MAWKTFLDQVYSGNSSTYGLRVRIQYNDATITTTKLTCRAISWLTKPPSAGSTKDTYFIYSSNGSISRICYLGSSKTSEASPYVSNTFTLTKGMYATSFSIPELALCNDGSQWAPSKYTDSNGRGYAVYFGGARDKYKTVLNEGGSSLATTAYVTNGTAPSLNIIDNKNNTCTISGTLGKNGTNNAMKSATLYYTTNGKNPDANESWTSKASLGATSAASFSKTVAIPSGCTKIIAIVYCNYTYNNSNSGNCSAAVKFRYGPMHSEPVATWTGQEEGKRLTTKAKVSFVWYDPDWTLADNKANYLPKECLNGYRIRMHEWKKGESSAASIHIGVNSDDSRWYDTWETTNTLAYGAEYTRSGNMNTCTVDPVKLGMVAGDKISIMVHGHYKTAGNPVLVWSNVIGSNAESVANSSPWAMFENEGIVNVKVDGEWKEGQVYVKANNEWKEAESVFTKVDGAWKESQ